MRCLIVDDNSSFRNAACNVLERAGVTIIGAVSNSAQALINYTKLNPDITLIDIGLGAECGFELAKQLHLVGLPTPSPLILMSAYDEEDIADMIAASPAVGFIPKLDLSVEAIYNFLGICEESGDNESSLSGPPGR
ncbi:response regulator [Mycobacterium sp. URHB0021]